MAGRRALGLGLALLVQALLLLVLLTLGSAIRFGVEDGRSPITTFFVEEVVEDAPEPRPEPEQQAQERPATQRPEPEEPQPPQPAEPTAAPITPPVLPTPRPAPPPAAVPPHASPAAPARPVYGPPDRRSAASRDTERVGTAPNGEPLYAAAWYREPDDGAMRAYLSGAHGPGWGLIACRTAPDFRVEDCVALDEYPNGSQINRALLAAAWEFRVRPPRRGGQSLVGAWVRIRFDYGIDRR